MELQWNKKACVYLQTDVHQVVNQEQTQEIRLPDGMPDIGRVLCAWGQPTVRSKEWRNDGMSVSGGVAASVLYQPEDGSEPRCAEVWIPFQARWSFPQAKREGSIRTRCLLRSIDARTLSARKLMVRASVGVLGIGLEPAESEVYIPGEVPAGVELLTREYPLVLPKEAGEKLFYLEEDVKIPGVRKWISWQLQPELAEQSVVGSRAVFRGTGRLSYVYLDENGNVQKGSSEIPFAQFGDLDKDYDREASLDVMMELSSVEPEITEEGAHVQCGIMAQYLVWGRELLAVAQDAYSPEMEVSVEKQTLLLPVELECREETLEAQAEFRDGRVTDVQFLPDFPTQYREGDGVSLEFPAQFQMLYQDEDGNTQCVSENWVGSMTLPAGRDSRIFPAVMGWQPVDAALPGARMKLRLQTTANQPIDMISAITVGERKERAQGRPSLILRRMDAESLWELAKASGSTVSAIRKANALTEEPAPGQMLLIPIS